MTAVVVSLEYRLCKILTSFLTDASFVISITVGPLAKPYWV